MSSADEPVERDIASAMLRTAEGVESSRIPVPVSSTPPTPRDGLPDYLAMVTAEIEAIEACRATAVRISEAVSPGTPRPSGAVPSQKRYATASALGVGELLLTARELTGLTQSQLAARASTSQSAISSMETGNRLPSARTLMRIAEAAGFELVVGLRVPEAHNPTVLGARSRIWRMIWPTSCRSRRRRRWSVCRQRRLSRRRSPASPRCDRARAPRLRRCGGTGYSGCWRGGGRSA